MTTYRLILSNGAKVEIGSRSAANAIRMGLDLNRGKTIVAMYSGLKQDDVERMKRMDRDSRAQVGYIDYEIPKHEAMPLRNAREQERKRGRPNRECVLFNDTEILGESERAQYRRDHQRERVLDTDPPF